MPSPMPSHITRIGRSATIGAERNGSTSGDITAFNTGDAPIKTPMGTPISTTRTPATSTRIVDHSVASNSTLWPFCESQASRPNAVITSQGAGSFALATSERPARTLHTRSTTSTPLAPAIVRVRGAIGAYGFHMGATQEREITASRVDRFTSRQSSSD